MKRTWDEEEIIKIAEEHGGGSTPENMVTTNTQQTITADKTISNRANIYRPEQGYDLIPANTGLINNGSGKRTCTLGSKIKVYINSDETGQRNEYIELSETDYFILRYDNSTSTYEFAVNTEVVGSVHWFLQDTTSNVIVSQGFVTETITAISCTPGYNGDFKLWFDYPTNIYSWSSNSDETYRYITLAERGTKIYHHHIRVMVRDEDYYWVDVLSTHPESFEGEDWEYLAEARCVGISAMYMTDSEGRFQKLYTICGYDLNSPETLSFFDTNGRVLTYSIQPYIEYDQVTI